MEINEKIKFLEKAGFKVSKLEDGYIVKFAKFDSDVYLNDATFSAFEVSDIISNFIEEITDDTELY